MEEIWRDIPGYEGAYQVSSLGRARSLPGGSRLAKVLKPVRAGRYWKVMPCVAGKVSHVYLHHAVAAAFIGPRPTDLDVCHNNGDRSDNRAENLRYDTASSNMRDAIDHGTHNESRRTSCDNGHEFTPENTLTQRNGDYPNGDPRYRRRCRACNRAAQTARRAAA